ncbi:MAG: amphi-Trp domain-containing protein [Deltaproteobacteria bacterium]|nr:amphi-Trp domain-containing protein [Deltaproteobacteria bacterium]
MSKSKAFEYEASISNDQLITHMENMIAGLRRGSITVDKGDGPVALDVAPIAKFSVAVKDTTKGKSLKIKLKWPETSPEAPPEPPDNTTSAESAQPLIIK